MTTRINPRISDPGAYARATGISHTPVEPEEPMRLRETLGVLVRILGDLLVGLLLAAWVGTLLVGLGAFVIGAVLLATTGEATLALTVAVACGLAWVPLSVVRSWLDPT